MDRGSRSARPLTGRAGADRTRTGGRGQLRPRAGAIAAEPVWRGAEPELSNFISPPHRGHGAIGSAPALQAGGYGFESRWLHHLFPILPCSSTGPPLPTPCAFPPGPLSPYALRRGSSFPCALLPAALLSPMPSSGGPPPSCSLVRAVRLSASSLWGAAVGGETGSLAGDSAHRTGAARAARPGRLRSAGAAPLGRATPATPERLLRPFPIPRSRAAASCAAPMRSVSSFAASPHTTRAPPRRSRRGRGGETASPQRVGSPVDFDAPQAPDALWITLSGSWLGDASGLPRVRTACSRRL